VSIVARLFLYIFLLMLAIGGAAQSRRRSWGSKPAAKLETGAHSSRKSRNSRKFAASPGCRF
jgi:hypothetical protein